MTERDEVALRLLCALMMSSNTKLDLYPELGEKQMQTCFMMADTFLKVAEEQKPKQPTVDLPYYNEACKTCGLPRDIHLGPTDPWVTTEHVEWGDRNRCRNFVRCDPPESAYGSAWWLLMKGEK